MVVFSLCRITSVIRRATAFHGFLRCKFTYTLLKHFADVLKLLVGCETILMSFRAIVQHISFYGVFLVESVWKRSKQGCRSKTVRVAWLCLRLLVLLDSFTSVRFFSRKIYTSTAFQTLMRLNIPTSSLSSLQTRLSCTYVRRLVIFAFVVFLLSREVVQYTTVVI